MLYVRQREDYTNPIGQRVVETRTSFYPTWDLLVASFEKSYYGISDQWTVTNDPLEPYFRIADTPS
jgi:hypothetical protein